MKYLTNAKYIPSLFLMDIFGSVLFFWKKLAIPPKQPKKILIIRSEHIGDVVMALPAIRSVRKSFPKAEIHVLGRELTKPLLDHEASIDKVICYDVPWFLRRQKKASLFVLISKLRKEKYDLAFEMHGDPRNLFIAGMTGAYVIGYGCRGGGFFANKIVEYKHQHMIAQNLDLVGSICNKIVVDGNIKTGVSFSKLAKKFSLPSRYVIINPLSGRAEKNLTVEEVGSSIVASKVPIVLTGAKSEAEFNSQFSCSVNLTGKTSLLELIEIVRHAEKVIAPDTGIVHIAHAVGTPCKAIYKVTDEKVWGY